MEMAFNKLYEKIETYNKVVLEANVPYAHILTLSTRNKSTLETIKQLESRIQIMLPDSLRNFYQHVGNIECNNSNENNSINIYSVDFILEHLELPDKWERIQSLGILDMILFNWGNDRYEIQELGKGMINYLNNEYTCFGNYTMDDGLESATYLYFDKKGNFGSLFYSQDDFDDLLQTYLHPLMNKSLANQTFEELLFESLNKITASKKDEISRLS